MEQKNDDMSIWTNYQNAAEIRGITKRDAILNRTKANFFRKLPDTLSYKTVIVYDAENGYNIDPSSPIFTRLDDYGVKSDQDDSRIGGEERANEKIRYDPKGSLNVKDIKKYPEGVREQSIAIINTDSLNEKSVKTLPDENLEQGSLIFWQGNHWLVTEKNADTELYTSAKILQCNHLLRWITNDGVVCEQWCVVEDGTKYLTGEYEDRNFVITRGDSRIALTLARNSQTVNLTRKDRFLIDDPDGKEKIAYSLTKPLKVGLTYNRNGVFKFILQEVNSTDKDLHELGIADFYKYFSVRKDPDVSESEPPQDNSEDKKDTDAIDNVEDGALSSPDDISDSDGDPENKEIEKPDRKVWI